MRFNTLAEWLAWQETLHPKSIDLGLARVRAVYQRLAVTPPPVTIAVAGTNGKGSCVAMLDQILRAAGYRVGAYTSPHLLRYNERIAVSGVAASDADICAAFEVVEAVRGDTTLSFFEFGTLAALILFQRANIDVQILEVGLGGRLDAVNIVDAQAALIAAIDIDHSEWLGDNRESIGLEKAGVFRPHHPAIVGDPICPESVRRHAAAIGARFSALGEHFGHRTDAAGWTWFNGRREIADLPRPALAGEHQLDNAAAVIQTLDCLRPSLDVSDACVRETLPTLRLSGRFQHFPGNPEVLVDVAHNPQAARILGQYLRSTYPDRTIRAVFSVMRDKDVAGIVAAVRDEIDWWYLAPLSMARAATGDELTPVFASLQLGNRLRTGFSAASEAFAQAKADAVQGELILVFGSFFLVSEYLAQLS